MQISPSEVGTDCVVISLMSGGFYLAIGVLCFTDEGREGGAWPGTSTGQHCIVVSCHTLLFLWVWWGRLPFLLCLM